MTARDFYVRVHHASVPSKPSKPFAIIISSPSIEVFKFLATLEISKSGKDIGFSAAGWNTFLWDGCKIGEPLDDDFVLAPKAPGGQVAVWVEPLVSASECALLNSASSTVTVLQFLLSLCCRHCCCFVLLQVGP